jgi:GT2 family glycosyltransferase
MKKISDQLAVVVLFWNDSDKTIKCLRSLFQQQKQKFDIVLVDNNSDQKYSKKILDWLKKGKFKFSKIKSNSITKKNNTNKQLFYIKNKINYGCGLGHNPGYEFCLKNKYDYIARIDNDMFVPKTLMHQLVKRLEKNRFIAAISPKVMFANNPNTIWFGGTKIGSNLKLQRECSNHICKKKDSKKFKGLIKTDAIVGCASVMRSKFLKLAGLSDPDFFYGEEDIELSHRFRQIGGELFIDLNQKIYHSVSHTVGTNWAKTIYYNYKYRLVLINKIGSVADKFFGYNMFVFKFFIMILLSFRKKYSSRIIQIFYAGLHFIQKKYGNYDRKKYQLIDKFFLGISKKTSLKDVISILNDKNKI